MLQDSGQAGTQIEITEAMLSAGVRVLEEDAPYFDEEVLASRVYKAMELAKYQNHHP